MMLTACESQELVNVRNMSIGSPPIGEIPNGAYRGAYAYGSFEYVVEVSIADGRIMGIKAIANRDTSHARSAEGVFPRIIDAQTPDVDAVTGATTTSKALMKAVENALAGAGQ
jgi:uncharacterized protein with FMN-binding domain